MVNQGNILSLTHAHSLIPPNQTYTAHDDYTFYILSSNLPRRFVIMGAGDKLLLSSEFSVNNDGTLQNYIYRTTPFRTSNGKLAIANDIQEYSDHVEHTVTITKSL